MRKHTIIIVTLIITLLAAGCSTNPSSAPRPDDLKPALTSVETPTTQAEPTATAVPTATPVPDITVFIPQRIPLELMEQLKVLPAGYIQANDEASADVSLTPVRKDPDFNWVYALVAPFPTVRENITVGELKSVYQGSVQGETLPAKLLMSTGTANVLDSLFGKPGSTVNTTVSDEAMLDQAWAEGTTWAIIPFEQLSPRWKVIRIDGVSPLDKNLASKQYPLSFSYGFTQKTDNEIDLNPLKALIVTPTNQDENKLTIVMLTGVTALARTTAMMMDIKGLEYPYRDIKDWLLYPDITHISNEVSFNEKCPPARPLRVDMLFCAPPEYIKFFTDLDIDVMELTGNHLVDFDVEALDATLLTYDEKGIPYYGGGKNLEDSMKPVLFEHNGNKIAFIGCNYPGPIYDFAQENRAGAVPCGDFDWVLKSIDDVKTKGYLPIVTVQHFETDLFMPISQVQRDMEMLADAGAVIVSGSQAHFPHGFTFRGDHFVHYGLGNLFFDQMFSFNKYEFLDQHYFYDGKYLGVELKMAMLEDWARPRPMTDEEKTLLLNEVFPVSNWTFGVKSETP